MRRRRPSTRTARPVLRNLAHRLWQRATRLWARRARGLYRAPARASRGRHVALALLLGAALGACTTTPPPVQQMSDARQAIAAARDAGAERLAPQVFSRSIRLMSMAESTLARKRYRLAADQASLARQLAIEAMELAVAAPGRPTD